ncbi:MAG: hypothetical protein GC168_11860 [Candidatus Hydrogenedens sp.]|nr:hypothetical protein [Candidatus Hydrogenedens sp.]
MNVFAACLIAAAALAQPAVTLPNQPAVTLPNQPGGAMQPVPESEPLNVTLFAIKASSEGRTEPSIPEELKPIAKALKKLAPADTFEIISQETKPSPFGQETQLPINGLFSGFVKLNETRPSSSGEGEVVDFNARIEMLRGSDFINALSTRGEAAYNQALIFRGMPLGTDELVVVLQVTQPDSDSSNQGQSGDEDSESQEDQQSPQQQEQAGEQDQQEEQQDQQPQQQDEMNQEGEGEQPPDLKNQQQEGEREGEQPQDNQDSEASQQSATDEQQEQMEEPKDMQTLEAMLENLEEQDRAEQKNAHYRRTQVKVRGDWW